MAMSESTHTAPAVEHKDEDDTSEVEELRNEVAELRGMVYGQQETIEQQRERVGDLEAELEKERSTREALISAKDWEDGEPLPGSTFISGKPIYVMVESNGRGVVELEDRLDQELDEEMQERGKNDAKLLRRINALAEKSEVEITDSDIMGEDKIRRVIKHGVEDVESKPTKAQERAEVLLRNIGEWATRAKDAYGDRFAISGPEAMQRLKDKRGEELASSQIKRVFKQIEEWGEDSPREVMADFSGSPNRLLISLEVDNDV